MRVVGILLYFFCKQKVIFASLRCLLNQKEGLQLNNLFFRCVLRSIFLVAFSSLFAQETASIFVQDPALFHKRQAELEQLKSSLEGSNEGLDSLLAEASRIAKINDQCSVISINDVMGEDCWSFYQVELPAFEEKFMQVTGEVRLGYMETTRGLEDRKLQINACVEALSSFASSKDQYLNLGGGVSLEPLNKGFEANYDFTLQYEPIHRKNLFAIAQKWGETCHEMVIRSSGEGFAPFFLEQLDKLNRNLANSGSLAVYKTDTTKSPTLYMDIAKSVRFAYYLNGVKLFHGRVAEGNLEESNLRIVFDKNQVRVEGEPIAMTNGTAQHFKGSIQFAEKSASMNGRWIWENRGNNEGVDFGPLSEEQPAHISRESKSFYFSPWVALTGGLAPYSHKTYKAFGLNKNDVMILTDVAAAARIRLNFGESQNGFAAFGAGVFVGAGINGEIQRLYIAPLVQVAVGYKNLGLRETAVFAIPEDHSEEWMQFRSGVFYDFGVIGVEAGFDFITNLGQGGYLSVFFEL